MKYNIDYQKTINTLDNIEELLNQTKKALEQIDANIAGVVVNKAPTTKRGKYSNYYE